jgi:hypothetical protein
MLVGEKGADKGTLMKNPGGSRSAEAPDYEDIAALKPRQD